MTAPSFERLDYRLRINKHIERRLVFDVLHTAMERIGFVKHRYVGLGALWFGDFRIAHRTLGIDEMVSMEFADSAARSEFNRPYRGIKVHSGSTHEVLARTKPTWWKRPAVFWFDYDGTLNTDVVSDIDTVLSLAAPDSVLILTVNADRQSYRQRPTDDTLRGHTAVGGIEEILGSQCVAPKFNIDANAAGVYVDISRDRFPEFIADAMSTYLTHKVVSEARVVAGESLQFVPLYRLHHKDGADMVTVGGAITLQSKAEAWRRCANAHPLIADDASGPTYTRLDLIPFTIKEKIALDLCLPYALDDAKYLAQARKRGLALADDDLRKYKKFYRHFPVFAEALL